MNTAPILTLASSSTYRAQLLNCLNMSYEKISPNIDERQYQHKSPKQLAINLSIHKAQAVFQEARGDFIIGGDQIAVCNTQILHKSNTPQEAIEHLRAINGQKVEYFSALCVYAKKIGKIHSTCIKTTAHIRKLSEKDIENYIHKDRPFDCSGSIRYETLGFALCLSIKSSDPFALQGIPLLSLCNILREYNLCPLHI